MSKQREAFEAFWRREMNVEVMDLARTSYPMTEPEDQAYKCGETDRGWMAWQASRAAALEEAAAVCCSMGIQYQSIHMHSCEHAIRALKEKS